MFRTKVEITHSSSEITYHDKIMTLGSCFAENIGIKLRNSLFQTDINPFGVLYNPISISQSIDLLLNKKQYSESDVFKFKSLWQSFSHSSLFSDTTIEGCLEKINSRLKFSSDFLSTTGFLMITLGTAWIFEEKISKKIVSNCHKLPSVSFERRRLSVNEIVEKLSESFKFLNAVNPDLKIIFSVSPIRHWKDGATENNLSKSTLLLAVNEISNQFNNVQYFPAYEIQMDELRDYRFYASDMLHPSETSIDYIWQRFSETYFGENTHKIKKQVEQLNADINHRPLHQDSIEFQQFVKIREERRLKVLNENPFLKDRIGLVM